MLLELHAHSYHSHRNKIKYDGIASPCEMIKAAAAKKIDAIALTDHNSGLGWKEAKKTAKQQDIEFIPGEEIDTSDGHVLALNISDVIMPGMSVEETVDKIHAQGGIAVASHPFDIKFDGTREKSLACDALEAFNCINSERFANKRCMRFARLHNKPVTAGSDAHAPFMIGRGLTVVRADSLERALREIKNGRTELIASYQPISAIMRWSIDKLKMSEMDVLSYIEENYRGPKKFISKKMLGLTRRSPGNIDIIFKAMAYFSLGSVVAYSAIKNAGR